MIPPSEQGIPYESSSQLPPLRTSGEHGLTTEFEYRKHLIVASMPPSTEHLRHTIGWPFNDAVMVDTRTKIPSYHTDENPGITIETPSFGAYVVRSPLDAPKVKVKTQESGLLTVILPSESLNIAVIIKNLYTTDLHTSTPLEKPDIGSVTLPVHKDDIIGNVDPLQPHIQLLLAYKPNRIDMQPEEEDLVDPLPFLRRLY